MIYREAAKRTANGQSAASRPCAHCGRPVPQPYSGNQLFRYCRDNEGACQRAARRIGMHRVGGPGLGDHVARAVVVTERLEHVVDALNEALHANLSPSGVERQIAAVRGEAAASVAAAHAQRDEARQEAHQARDEAEQARREADLARDEVRQSRAELAVAREQADLAMARATNQAATVDRTAAERDAVRQQLTEVETARTQAVRERDEAAGALTELPRLRAEVTRLQGDLERSRSEAGRHNNRLTAAIGALREEVARAQQKLYEQDSVRAAAERRSEALALRLRTAEIERDAARAELESARFQAARIDEQVSNLASALARLGNTGRIEMPAPATPPEPLAPAGPAPDPSATNVTWADIVAGRVDPRVLSRADLASAADAATRADLSGRAEAATRPEVVRNEGVGRTDAAPSNARPDLPASWALRDQKSA
jgi:DNA repair exonuclease SbcCD ATPase subunit